MESKALISVLSIQVNDEDSSIEVITPGEFYKEDDHYCVVYNETEISGMDGTQTTFNIYEDKFLLMRVGTTTTTMDFRKNTKSLSLYNTPYGMLELEIETKEIQMNISDEGGSIFIDYNLCISGQPPQETILKIKINAK